MNVTIQWSKGAPPVLTIYDLESEDNTVKIELAQYDDKERLDTMMVEQGFRKRTEAEKEARREEIKKQKQRDLEAAENRRAADRRKKEERLARAQKLADTNGASTDELQDHAGWRQEDNDYFMFCGRDHNNFD